MLTAPVDTIAPFITLETLNGTIVARVRDVLNRIGESTGDAGWLADGRACDIPVAGPSMGGEISPYSLNGH